MLVLAVIVVIGLIAGIIQVSRREINRVNDRILHKLNGAAWLYDDTIVVDGEEFKIRQDCYDVDLGDRFIMNNAIEVTDCELVGSVLQFGSYYFVMANVEASIPVTYEGECYFLKVEGTVMGTYDGPDKSESISFLPGYKAELEEAF